MAQGRTLRSLNLFLSLLYRLRTHWLTKKVANRYKYYLTKLGARLLVTALLIREYLVQPTVVRNAPRAL